MEDWTKEAIDTLDRALRVAGAKLE